MEAKIVEVPNVHEERGKLAVLQNGDLPFKIERVYYLYDIPSDSFRGGHAHKVQESLVIALSGSFEVKIDNGEERETIQLNKPNKGLYIPTMVWRELDNFSSGAVCLVLASNVFDEDEYIRDYDDFLRLKGL